MDQIVLEAMVSVIAQTWNSRSEAEASDAHCRRLGFIDYPLSDKESANLALARECGEEPWTNECDGESYPRKPIWADDGWEIGVVVDWHEKELLEKVNAKTNGIQFENPGWYFCSITE